MDTVIIQSYRTERVPRWMTRCMDSVKRWTSAQGYDYRFVGDEIFALVPDWYRERTGHALPLQTDLARLILARDALKEGYRRAVWLDADVLVFAPKRLALPEERNFYFCREVWLDYVNNALEISDRVNNCACVFAAGNGFLDFYIDACLQLVRETKAPVSPLLIGTRFLTFLDRILTLPRLATVGLLGPYLVRDIGAGGGAFLDNYKRHFATPVYAANLCASFHNRSFPLPSGGAFTVDDAAYAAAIEALLAAGENFIAGR